MSGISRIQAHSGVEGIAVGTDETLAWDCKLCLSYSNSVTYWLPPLVCSGSSVALMIWTQALQDTLIFLSDDLDSGIIPSKTLSSPLLCGATLPPPSPSATTSSNSANSSPEEASSGRGSRRSSHMSHTFQPYPKPMLGESTAMHFTARALRGEEPKLGLSDHNKVCTFLHQSLVSSHFNRGMIYFREVYRSYQRRHWMQLLWWNTPDERQGATMP